MARLVLRVGVGQDGDDALELTDECLDFGPGELASGRLPAELSLETLALPLDLGDPGRDHGDVGVQFEELPVAGKLSVAFLEMPAQVELASLVVLGLEVAGRGQGLAGGIDVLVVRRTTPGTTPGSTPVRARVAARRLAGLVDCVDCARNCARDYSRFVSEPPALHNW
jgi:hypothetical protein